MALGTEQVRSGLGLRPVGFPGSNKPRSTHVMDVGEQEGAANSCREA